MASPDTYVLSLCDRNPNLLVAHWLIASLMYYVEDQPILSDAAFDEIVARLTTQWDALSHPHKHLLDKGLLKSGFYLQEYPEMVQGAATMLRADLTPRRRRRVNGLHR